MHIVKKAKILHCLNMHQCLLTVNSTTLRDITYDDCRVEVRQARENVVSKHYRHVCLPQCADQARHTCQQ